MPISGIYCHRKIFHVLSGQQSSALVDNVTMSQSSILLLNPGNRDAGHYLHNNNDVTLTFRPLFKGVQQGNLYERPGVSFNLTTGSVLIDYAVADIKVRNFMLEIKATDISSNEDHFSYVKYEVHESIKHTWLTPNTLNIPKHRRNFKFSVYAEFDDGLIGDLSDVDDIVWSSPNNNINVGKKGILLISPADNINEEIEITATLPPRLQSKQAKGILKVDPPWDNTHKFTIEAVTTGNSPGYIRRNDVPNVMFISEGFDISDKAAFNQQVDVLVEKLAKDEISFPFNYLSGSMNFWKLFLPSHDELISWHTEVYIDSDSCAREIPFAKVTPNPQNTDEVEEWKMENLIYFAGLPVPELKTKSIDELRSMWINLLRLNDDDVINEELVSSIDSDLIEDWIEFADRRLLEENNTALGLRYGIKPTSILEPFHNTEKVKFNPLKRFGRFDLDKLFKHSVDKLNRPLANLWENGKKDSDFLVFLTNKIGGRASNQTGFMIVPERESSDVAEIEAASSLLGVTGNHKAVKLKRQSIPKELALKQRGVFIHELCHSFGLGDEYGEEIEDTASPFFKFTGGNSATRFYGNLELDSVINNKGNFNGDLIKWRWHRIETCAVLSGSVTKESENKLKIPTKGNQSTKFAVDDEVFLRDRKLKFAIDRNPTLSSLLKVISTADDHLICELKSHTQAEYDAVENFVIHNIVYKPKKANEAVFDAINYPFAELITKNIRDFITENNRPLTVHACVIDNNSQTAPDDLPDLPGVDFCFKDKPKIIGLYSGGLKHHCGVYHPSGICMMRNHYRFFSITELCAVCRYVLTEFIDPSKHPEVDAKYTVYPEV